MVKSAFEQAKDAVGRFLFPQVPAGKPLQKGETVSEWQGYKDAFRVNPPPSIDFGTFGKAIGGAFSNLGRTIKEAITPVSTFKYEFRTPSATPSATPSVIPRVTPTIKPSVTPIPTITPAPVSANGFFDFSTIKRDPVYAATGPRPGFQPTQPPADIGNLIRSAFPKEATTAALVASTENATFDPKRSDHINPDDGSIDRGIFQINSNTFNGLMQRRGAELQAKGIFNFDDMWDARKNIEVAKMIYDEAGWRRWFGWQDTGYDINQSFYSQPARKVYEIALRGGKYKTR